MNQNPTRCDAPRCLDPLSLIHGSPPGPRSFKQWLDSTRARAEMRGGQTSGWMGNVTRDRSARIAVTRRGLRRLGGALQVVADVAQGSAGKGEMGAADGGMGDLGAARGGGRGPRARRGPRRACRRGTGRGGRGSVASRPAWRRSRGGGWPPPAAMERAGSTRRPTRRCGPCDAGAPGCRGRRLPRRRDRSGTAGVKRNGSRPIASGRPGRCPRSTSRRAGRVRPARRRASAR